VARQLTHPAEAPAQPRAPSPRAGRPEPGSRRFGRGILVAALALLTADAVGLYLLSLQEVELDGMNGFGLISVLPWPTMLALGLLTVAFIGALSLQRPVTWLLVVQLIVLVGCLHGITALLESQPRFPITWLHAGFVEYIDRTGTTATNLDARFSWPGFFALVAFWAGSGDRSALHWVLTLAPVVSNLLYLAALGLLMSRLRVSWQARWLAAWLFCSLNWVGQDYFSPQGWTFLLYLLVMAILITWFRPTADAMLAGPPRRRLTLLAQRWRQRLWPGAVPGELEPSPAGAAEKVVLLAVVIGLFTVAVVSHQLTPFLMLTSCAGLVLARRCTLSGLPVILGVIMLGALSYLTRAYWSGHLADLLSSIGDLDGTVSSSVAQRAAGGDRNHQLVVYTRMGAAVVLFLLAGWGLLRRRVRGIEDRTLLVLLVMPFSVVLLQSYGGEIALRVYLFSLAPAAVLAALAFFPESAARPSLLRGIAAGTCALLLPGVFLVTRYGNEQYEQIRDGAVAAVEAVYDRTEGRGLLVFVSGTVDASATPFMPLGYREIERVGWLSTQAPRDPTDVTDVVGVVRDRGPGTYLITTDSQEAHLVLGDGYPPGWGDRFRRALAETPGVRVVVENPDAAVYTVSEPAGGTAAPPASRAIGVRVGSTPWTPLGVAFMPALLVLYGWREVRRLRLPPQDRERLRPLTLAALPLLVGFVLVVLERFVLLS
jgi:hypothetical protein